MSLAYTRSSPRRYTTHSLDGSLTMVGTSPRWWPVFTISNEGVVAVVEDPEGAWSLDLVSLFEESSASP